ncbi:MAG: hypothetical protein EOP14_00090 [Pseudomonas sp.]|nr:MAG: hypothetical protein EOP14_00090 [Pseudomonas sp.]
MIREDWEALGAIVVVAVCIAGPIILAVVGWVLNIVKLVPMEGPMGMLLLRAAGIILAPLGAVLGYIG